MTPKKLTRTEQKAMRPVQILDAAFDEFIEKGFSAARVEDIARRIGVTKGTIYVYFATKEEIFSAMVRHIAVPFEAVQARSHQLSGNYSDQLRSLLLLCYQHIIGDRRTRELLRFAMSEGMRFPQLIDAHYCELVEPILEKTQALIDEGVRSGEFRRGPAAFARVVVGPFLAMIVEMLIHGDQRNLDLPQYIEAHLDLVVHGLSRV